MRAPRGWTLIQLLALVAALLACGATAVYLVRERHWSPASASSAAAVVLALGWPAAQLLLFALASLLGAATARKPPG